MKKWLLRGGIGLLAILFLALAGGFLWLRTSLPVLSGQVAIRGVAAPAEIIYDRHGIPHIRARSQADAYRALGLVHARDRLFQMESMRRLGAGRLSEFAGARALPIDRMMRTLGMYRLAEDTYRQLPPTVQAHVRAYAEGVNAYLETHAGALPPEFLLTRHVPELWRPADSLVWGRLMGLRLSGNWQMEALRTRLADRLSQQQIEELFAVDDHAPTTLASDARSRPATGLAALMGSVTAAFPDELRQVSASNSWGIAGSRTATGKPILANDPHLGFQAPGLWYLARISAPGLEVTGATVPGVPFHILGHNGRIAWAFTTTDSDTQDLFVERLTAGREGYYDTPDGPRPFETRTEVIRVRGGEPLRLTVRETRHGPVISGLDDRFARYLPADRVVALAATTLRPDDLTPLALYRMNRAGDWPSFRAAVRDFHAPQQNITYADTRGTLAFIAPARVPVRRSGDGSVPAIGWTGENDWTGFVPFDELPQTVDPAEGRIVNANNRIVPQGYKWLLTRDWSPAFRARRIHQLLDAAARHSIDSSAEMHRDEVSLAARKVLPEMLRAASGPAGAGERHRRALALLRGWDGTMARNALEPLLFAAWLRRLNRDLYADETGELFSDVWQLRPDFVHRVLTRIPRWCDDVGTDAPENCADIVSRSLDRALEDLARRYGDDMSAWRWGRAHQARFRHPVFGWIPVLNRLADIRVESGGGAFTVNRAQYYVARDREPFTSVHGPGYRAIYDLSNLSASRFATATGQSGNPLSPRYDDVTAAWRDGRYVTIPESRATALEGARGVLTLMPRE